MGNIITEPVRQYLTQWYQPLTPFLQELRLHSEERDIPIILRDTETFMVNLLLLKNPVHILEIGTAVGYSSLFFAALLPECRVTTLERSSSSAYIARENIQKAGLSHRIEVICGDAKETLPVLAGEGGKKGELRFDLIFIDGAKGHYLQYWEDSRPLWERDALILSDNVLYKGITASEEYLTCRRDKTIMRRMREYLTYISQLPGVRTCVLPIGDGLAMSTVCL